MNTQPNDAANPIVVNELGSIIEGGLTKREYFAAMAIQGLVSTGQHSEGVAIRPTIGILSVQLSDALINALNAQP